MLTDPSYTENWMHSSYFCSHSNLLDGKYQLVICWCDSFRFWALHLAEKCSVLFCMSMTVYLWFLNTYINAGLNDCALNSFYSSIWMGYAVVVFVLKTAVQNVNYVMTVIYEIFISFAVVLELYWTCIFYYFPKMVKEALLVKNLSCLTTFWKFFFLFE